MKKLKPNYFYDYNFKDIKNYGVILVKFYVYTDLGSVSCFIDFENRTEKPVKYMDRSISYRFNSVELLLTMKTLDLWNNKSGYPN